MAARTSCRLRGSGRKSTACSRKQGIISPYSRVNFRRGHQNAVKLRKGKGVFHYTNSIGYKAIVSQKIWLFKASKPPGDHLKGAYFTNLPPGTKNLAKRLFIRGSTDKVAFVFWFSGDEGLTPLAGGRGEFIFYSQEDYAVVEDRQRDHGETEQVKERMHDRRN